MAIDNTNPGGLGGLGGFGNWLANDGGDILQAIGYSLMSSPRNAPLSGFPQAMQMVSKEGEKRQEQQAIEMLLVQSGFPPDEAKRLARNPAIANMALQQKKERESTELFERGYRDMNGEGSAPATPRQPVSATTPSPAPARPAPLSAYNEADPAAGGEGRPSMIGQPMPTLAPTTASIPVGDENRDLLIRTVIGEAAREPEEGQAAVAHTVLNRVNSGRFGGDIPSVLFAPKQFEPWNTRRQELMAISPDSPVYQRAAQIVDRVLAGEIPDPTQGATHFQNPDVVRQRGNSSGMRWYQDMVNNGSAVRIGQHVFGSPDGQPGARGVQVASLGGTPSGAASRMLDPASIQLDGLPPGPVPSGEGAEASPRLAQVAQASGAMPGSQPSIRNIVPPTMMPGLNAFAPEGARTWSGSTAQLPQEQRITASDPLPRMTSEEANPSAAMARTREQALAEGRKYAYYIAHPRAPAGLKELAKLKYQQIMEDSKLTNEQKEYLQSVSQGFNGTFVDYKRSLQPEPTNVREYEYIRKLTPEQLELYLKNKREGGTNIVNNPGEKAAEQVVGKAAGERQVKVESAWSTVPDRVQRIQLAKSLLGSIQTGRLAGFQGSISDWALSVGVSPKTLEAVGIDPKLPATSQSIAAEVNRSLVGMIGSGGFPANNFSNADRDFLTRIFPSISNRPEANALILEVQERAARQELDAAEDWQAAREAGKSFTQWERDYATKVREQNIFKDVADKIKAISSPTQSGRSGSASPPPAGVDPKVWRYMTPEERNLWK